VARVEVSTRALRDLERLCDFVAEADPKRALAQLSSVRAAFEVLADHPLLGRVADNGRRELVLSRDKYGYIPKYRWLVAEDVELILAVRHQLEAGYTEEQKSRRFGAYAIDGRPRVDLAESPVRPSSAGISPSDQ
jgi:plasmid stabilization system protein ParE